MKEFLGWLTLLVVLLMAVLVVFFIVANITGGGLSDRETDIGVYGIVALGGLIFVGYILDPNATSLSKRRRRR